MINQDLKTWLMIKKHIKQTSKYYQEFASRKFAKIDGYPSCDRAFIDMAMTLETAEYGIAENKGWAWMASLGTFYRLYLEKNFHVFRVDRELAIALDQTQLPNNFGKIAPTPFNAALFLLPNNLFISNSTDKETLNWLAVCINYPGMDSPSMPLRSGGEIIFKGLYEEEKAIGYKWSSQSENKNILLTATLKYDENGELINRLENYLDRVDTAFTNRISNLVQNLLLWIDKPKEYDYEKAIAPTRAKGFSKPSQSLLTPIKLSFDSQPHRVIYERPQDASKRKSPRPHLRRAHWRRVAVGEGRKNREWRLIPLLQIASNVND